MIRAPPPKIASKVKSHCGSKIKADLSKKKCSPKVNSKKVLSKSVEGNKKRTKGQTFSPNHLVNMERTGLNGVNSKKAN